MSFAWIQQVKKLSAANLTVRAQSIDPSDNGTLKWATIFPREDVESHDVTELITKDFRPVGSRREWDANGQRIPIVSADVKKISIIPIETEDVINEKEMTTLKETFDNNQNLIVDRLKVRIPQRSDTLALAAYRTLEQDCWSVLLKGYLDQKDPQTNRKYRTSFGINPARQTIAGSSWATGAYGKFITWLKAGKFYVKGGIIGVLSTNLVTQTIFDDAPVLANGQRMGYDEFYKDIRNRTGLNITFIENDETADFPQNGGTNFQKGRFFDEGYMAIVPAGGTYGKSAFAKVTRAQDLSAQVPNAKIDVRGVSVFHYGENNDKSLKMQAQLDAMPIPNEEKIFTIDTLIRA